MTMRSQVSLWSLARRRRTYSLDYLVFLERFSVSGAGIGFEGAKLCCQVVRAQTMSKGDE